MNKNTKNKILAVGIIFLFFGISTTSSSGNQIIENIKISGIIGNTLYVGGSGPDNYTKIQDAIDNSSNGDTVFVYDDSSPYYENIVINKSIKLIGEDRDTTIIDSTPDIKDKSAILITGCCVTISGFTICNRQNNTSYPFCGGIKTQYGLENIKITGNYFVNNTYGIWLDGGYHIIRNNVIYNCTIGLFCYTTFYTLFSRNNFSNCSDYGIFLFHCFKNIIIFNNFIENKCSISFEYDDLLKFLTFILLQPLQLNKFFRNYYSDHSTKLPKIIKGSMLVWEGERLPFYDVIDWINFDWRPAKEPYDIKV